MLIIRHIFYICEVKLQSAKLRELIRAKGFTVESFGKKLDLTRNGTYDILKRKYLKPELIEKISQILSVQSTDFIDYELPKNAQDKLGEPEISYERKGNIIYVPIRAQGGFLTGYSNKVFMDSLQHFFLPGITGQHYAFEVDGMSMYDFASPGDWAIASEVEKLEYMLKGKPYVLQTTDGLLIKYFSGLNHRDEKALFTSHNKDYGTIVLPLKSIKKIYFVSRIVKKV